MPNAYVEMNDRNYRDDLKRDMSNFRRSWSRNKNFVHKSIAKSKTIHGNCELEISEDDDDEEGENVMSDNVFSSPAAVASHRSAARNLNSKFLNSADFGICNNNIFVENSNSKSRKYNHFSGRGFRM